MFKKAFLDASKTCSVCVLPHEFSSIHVHGILTALPRPLSCLASPRPCQCCLGLGAGLVKTASPTSLEYLILHVHTYTEGVCVALPLTTKVAILFQILLPIYRKLTSLCATVHSPYKMPIR